MGNFYYDTCNGSSGSGLATDGSGYNLTSFVGQGLGGGTATIYSRSGVKISPPVQLGTGSGTLTDPNQNKITTDGTYFKDTAGTTLLTVTGGAPSNLVFTYTAPSTAPASVTITYRTYTVQTNFNVWVNGSRIVEYPATQQSLVDAVTLPDASTYHFTYELTANSNGTNVTGRIASVTLPTGGTIIYGYGSGVNYMMADGSPLYMWRTLGGGTWQYWRAVQSGQASTQTSTTIVDPFNNETDLNFSGIYETSRLAYTGNHWYPPETLLKSTFSCYNGNFSSCSTATVTAPIQNRFFYDYFPNSSLYRLAASYFDGYGNLTTQNDYGYTTGSASIIRNQAVGYSSTLCSSLNVCDRPLSVQVNDGSSHQFGLTNYGYDGLGNVTSVQRWVSGSNYLTQQYSYNTGGTLNTATDPKGTVTTYGYAGTSCNNAFPTSVTVNSLITSYAYNCTGGVVTSVTDANGAAVSTTYNDSHYWRPASMTDQLNNVTSFNYYPTLSTVGQVESVMNFSGSAGSSTTDVFTIPDNLGRPSLTQTREGPGSGYFDTVETDYDAAGNVSHRSLPFATTNFGQPNPSAYGTSIQYDALRRPTTVTDAAGGTTSYSYNLNDVQVTFGPTPQGENGKSRNFEYDSQGRLTSVCEYALSGTWACGSQSYDPYLGYMTAYTYDAAGNFLTANESGQARSFTYDGLGRMLSETNPETSANGSGGTTNYVYDSIGSGNCSGTSNGDLLKRTDPAGNVTCYGWDSVHRLAQVTYPNSSATGAKYFTYDNSYPHNIASYNAKGRLTAADTYVGGQWTTSEVFSYDARGEATDLYEIILGYGPWYRVNQSYFANGVATTPLGYNAGYSGTGNTPFSNGFLNYLDGKGRPIDIWDSGWSHHIWTGATYNAANQPTAVTLVGGAENFAYDPYTDRMTQWSSTAGSNTQTGNLTWNANGTLRQLQISDNYDANNAQTCLYGYDDLMRLLSANCGSAWSQTFSYDAFGNITKTGSLNLRMATARAIT